MIFMCDAQLASHGDDTGAVLQVIVISPTGNLAIIKTMALLAALLLLCFTLSYSEKHLRGKNKARNERSLRFFITDECGECSERVCTQGSKEEL
jgi:hypothetical protein